MLAVGRDRVISLYYEEKHAYLAVKRERIIWIQFGMEMVKFTDTNRTLLGLAPSPLKKLSLTTHRHA